MGTKTVQKCDGCGRTTDDFYTFLGWIHFCGTNGISSITISRSAGRTNGNLGSAISDFLSGIQDFCSIGCLVECLDKKAQERFKIQNSSEYEKKWLISVFNVQRTTVSLKPIFRESPRKKNMYQRHIQLFCAKDVEVFL